MSLQIFAPVRPPDVRSLAGPTLEVRVPDGAELVHEGDPIGTFFVIRSGSAEVWQHGVRVRELGCGECFGEVDPADGHVPDYTVIAGHDLRLLTFSTLGIGRLCALVPQVRSRLLEALPTGR